MNSVEFYFQSIEIYILLNEVYVLYHLVHLNFASAWGVLIFLTFWASICFYFVLIFYPDFPTSQSPSLAYFTKPLNSILQKDVGQSFETFATVLAVFFHQKPTFKVFEFVKKLFIIISASALILKCFIKKCIASKFLHSILHFLHWSFFIHQQVSYIFGCSTVVGFL